MPASFRLRILALALPLLLAACATTTQPEPPRSTRGATDDLGLIADLALSLAERHGANDVLVIEGEKERLVPFIADEVILDVDVVKGVIRVDWEWD